MLSQPHFHSPLPMLPCGVEAVKAKFPLSSFLCSYMSPCEPVLANETRAKIRWDLLGRNVLCWITGTRTAVPTLPPSFHLSSSLTWRWCLELGQLSGNQERKAKTMIRIELSVYSHASSHPHTDCLLRGKNNPPCLEVGFLKICLSQSILDWDWFKSKFN